MFLVNSQKSWPAQLVLKVSGRFSPKNTWVIKVGNHCTRANPGYKSYRHYRLKGSLDLVPFVCCQTFLHHWTSVCSSKCTVWIGSYCTSSGTDGATVGNFLALGRDGTRSLCNSMLMWPPRIPISSAAHFRRQKSI